MTDSVDPDGGSGQMGNENVLVLASAVENAVAGVVGSLIEHPDETGLLAVSLSGRPDDIVDRVPSEAGGEPARVATITAGPAPGASGSDDAGRRSLVVSDPGDLTGLGIRIEQCFTAWQDAVERIALCFDSLTTLLQFADLATVFRFVHTLTRKADSIGAGVVFSLDPATVEDQTLRTLRSPFDRVVDRT